LGLIFNGLAMYPDYRIFIYTLKYERYSDDDLRILIAHEVGHCIDYFTNRCGHPLLIRLRKLSREEFANVIAAYLYSKEMVLDVAGRKKWPKCDIEIINKIDFTVRYKVANSVDPDLE